MKNPPLQLLQQLGFTKRQADMYLMLLAHGPSAIGTIQSQLQIHKQLIYTDLERLEQKGLVFVSKANSGRYFHAADPEVILEKQQNQTRVAEELIPRLHALTGWEQGASEITIFEGFEAVQSFHRSKVKKQAPNSAISVLGAGGNQLLKVIEPNNTLAYYDIVRERKNITQRLLMRESQRSTCPKYTEGRFGNTVRYMQSNAPAVMATQIWPDSVALLFFLDKPKIVEIKSHQAVQTYLDYFNLLWNQAKT